MSERRAAHALAAAIRAHHARLDAEERFDQAMWEARAAGVTVRELAAAVGMSKSEVSRRYKRPGGEPLRAREAPL